MIERALDRAAPAMDETPRGNVLIIEDDEAIARVLTRLLGRDGYTVTTAGDGQGGLAAVSTCSPDVILLDVGLPNLNGYQVCRALKADPATRLIPVIFLTGLDARDARIAGINAGGQDFLSKPVDHEELRARVGSLVRLKRQTDELESAESVIMGLALTIAARDDYTGGHCGRMMTYAAALGMELGMRDDAIKTLSRGAFLHDVGKVGIPDSILLKPSSLTADECIVMQQHTVIGDALCGNMHSLAALRPIVRHHHERLDGSGYPDGLAGSEVPLFAQIVGIVDSYDAMTTTRPYRQALDRTDACRRLGDDARTGKLNPAFVSGFVGLVESDSFAAPPQ